MEKPDLINWFKSGGLLFILTLPLIVLDNFVLPFPVVVVLGMFSIMSLLFGLIFIGWIAGTPFILITHLYRKIFSKGGE